MLGTMHWVRLAGKGDGDLTHAVWLSEASIQLALASCEQRNGLCAEKTSRWHTKQGFWL